MKKFTRLKDIVLASAMALPAAGACAVDPLSDAWQFSLTPYLWLPNFNGTLKYQTPPGTGGRPEVEAGPNDYLSNLDFVLMLSGEARKGEWGLLGDYIYLDFSSEESTVKSVSGPGGSVQVPVDAGTKTGLSGVAWQFAGFYNAVNTPSTSMDALAGMRYFRIKASVAWQLAGSLGLFPQSGSYSEEEELVDAIVGIRGKVRPGGGKWYVPYYLDIGTGSSSLTWQALTGIGYSMGWGDIQLSYRHLFYDQGSDKLVQDFSFSGPAIGASFKF